MPITWLARRLCAELVVLAELERGGGGGRGRGGRFFFQYWYPDAPAWLPAFFTLLVLLGLNMLAVRIFGEVEFWFGIIKIVAIVLLIITQRS